MTGPGVGGSGVGGSGVGGPGVGGSGLAGRPATDLAAAVRSGSLRAVDVVAAHLDRIRTVDPGIGAFVRVRSAAALHEAAALDDRGDLARLPLAGVPIAVKDNLAVAGEPMTEGCPAVPADTKRHDHAVVARLRAAGAIVVGITRMPELGLWGVTEGVRNPWRPDRTPGGSSGGSAAAVAAGMVPIAVGNDGLGSIRIPAACCGVVGMKPGPGVLPAANVTPSDWFGMTENGPLATTIADLETAFAVMAGRTPGVVPRPAGSAPLRVAVSLASPMPGVAIDRSWKAGTLAVGDALTAEGHDVRHADPPYPLLPMLAIIPRWLAGITESERADVAPLQARSRHHVRAGHVARRLRLVRPGAPDALRSALAGFFATFDVLITPTLARPPLPGEGWEQRGWWANALSQATFAPMTPPWNLTGWPAGAVPAGLHPDGTPLSAQIVAPPGGEHRVLDLMDVVERTLPWQRLAPVRAA